MKRLKSLLSLLLAVCFVLGGRVCARAQETPTLRIVDVSAYRSQTVDVAVELSNNPGIVALFIEIGYDTSILSLQSVQDGGLLGVGTMVAGGDKAENPYRVLWSDALSTSNHTQNGILVTFTFAVDANAPLGDTQITLTSKDSSCFDSALNLVSFRTQNGTLTVNAPVGHIHEYETSVTPPTCTEQGYLRYTCTLCGVCFTTNEVAPVGHSFGAWNVVKEATQTNPGEKERFCVQCNARETQVIPIAPSVSILNFRPNMTVDYRTTITFAARVSNPVDTAEIHWYWDGKDVGTGEQFTAKEVKKAFTVQAKLMCDGEILAESQIQTVEVKTAFIEKIIAFFKALFGKLPVLTQSISWY